MEQDTKNALMYDASKKSTTIAYLLLIFFGTIGAHRFYLGRIGSAVAMLIIWAVSFVLSFVGFGLFGYAVLGVWVLIDLFLTHGIVKDYNLQLIKAMESYTAV